MQQALGISGNPGKQHYQTMQHVSAGQQDEQKGCQNKR